MSRIKELKELKENNINLIDVLQMIYPKMETKYYDLMVRLIKNDNESKGKGSYSENLFFVLMCDYIKSKIKSVEVFTRFADYNEKNQIKQNDLSRYKRFLEVSNEVSEADRIAELKEIESQAIKIFENDAWQVVKPTTHLSSVKYGYGSKWCTAMKDNSSYFNDYGKRGILIYCINKKDNNKSVAIFKDLSKKTTYWSSTDQEIDLFDCNLPMDVFEPIRNSIMNDKTPNYIPTTAKKSGDKSTSSPALEDLLRQGSNNGNNNNGRNELYERAYQLMRNFNY